MGDVKKVLIVGVGALGSHVIQFIRSEPNIEIHIMDFDRIEQRNCYSQFHSINSRGKKKSSSLQKLMNFLFGTKIISNINKLEYINKVNCLGGYDVIVDCLDNGESRRLMSDFSKEFDVPCLHGALSQGGTFGQIVWDEKFSIDDAPEEGTATCQEGEFLPFIALVSSYLAISLQVFLRKNKKSSFIVSPKNLIII